MGTDDSLFSSKQELGCPQSHLDHSFIVLCKSLPTGSHIGVPGVFLDGHVFPGKSADFRNDNTVQPDDLERLLLN
jgi:hypothetical protein